MTPDPAQPSGTGAPAPSGPALDTQKLMIARLWAIKRHPYLASALFASPVISVPGLGKAATDESWRLYIDPEVVNSHSMEVLGSLLVHHAGHLVRDHAGRAQSLGVDRRLAKDWALAADAEINDDLVGTGLRLPEDRIIPQELGWAPGRMAEEYFHIRHHDVDDEHEPDCGSGSDGLARDWEMSADQNSGIPPGEQRLLRSQVASDVLRYMREGVGRLSGGWTRWAEDQLEPKVDWRRVLAAEIRKGLTNVSGKVDYTYRRLSRRASALPDVVLPALERPLPEVLVLCDTSGSMDDELLAQVLAEVDGLLKGVGLARNRLRVMSVDAAAHTVQRVANARSIQLVGGGGTDMGAGIEAAARLRPPPSVVVVLTDGLTPWPDQPPKRMQVVVGLIQCVHLRRQRAWAPPPWARVVHIDAPEHAA
ncbi:MAG: VWA-like domain-containing protein [Acidimicrobiales bacterium]